VRSPDTSLGRWLQSSGWVWWEPGKEKGQEKGAERYHQHLTATFFKVSKQHHGYGATSIRRRIASAATTQEMGVFISLFLFRCFSFSSKPSHCFSAHWSPFRSFPVYTGLCGLGDACLLVLSLMEYPRPFPSSFSFPFASIDQDGFSGWTEER